MTSNDTILELITTHVLHDGEQVVRVKNWPDGLALTTDLRHFVAGSYPGDWSISRQAWVDDVVIATRDDLLVEGQPERFGFVLRTDGAAVYLNDAGAVGELGQRLADDLDPVAYAQILVAFHPYSSAYRGVLSEPGDMRRYLEQPDLPDVAPLRLRRSTEGVTLSFSSFVRYRRPGQQPLLDVFEWTVHAASGEPARWQSRKTIEARVLEPRHSDAVRPNWNQD